jgi:hypothetical protein
MDLDFQHVLWGVLGVLVLRKVFNTLSKEEHTSFTLMGRPSEMKDVDNTSLGSAVYTPVGPYAVK